ncbi:MAG TPA: ABC transporter substrate-binding protein [Stellaceae bacterium]|nr:ABC transporter substrate-binding protein [Stellaceae bacterium]
MKNTLLWGVLLLGGIGTLALTPAAMAQVSPDGLKIGVLTDMSSVYSMDTGPGSLLAARMAVEDFGGKVLGKPIQVLSANHQNKTDVGAAIARQWLDQDQVAAIVDLPTSPIALAVQQLARERNRVLLMSGTGSSELTGPACSPTGIQWTYDTYGQASVAADGIVSRGGKSWFFVTADYAFGHAFERDATASVKRLGGTVVGGVRHPLNTPDFSSFLLQAQASKAQVVALANAGGDTATAIKQAAEFGLIAGGQQVAALLTDANEIKAIGLKTAEGLMLASAWYWDLNDQTRAFANRFLARQKAMPSAIQAGVYSVVTNYLKAVQATGTAEAKAVVAKMRATPVNDMFTTNGHLREDGRMVHDMYLMRVKKPEESKNEWDLFTLVATVPGDKAFRPLKEGGCPLVQ